MRRVYNIIISVLALAAVACATDGDVAGYGDNTAADDKGAMRLNISPAEAASDAPFALRIFSVGAKGERNLVRKYNSIDEIPEYIWLVAGSYCATVERGEAVAAAFDGEYYYGEQEFVVTPGIEPGVVDIICYAENIPVEVAYEATVTEATKSGGFEGFATKVVAGESLTDSAAPQLEYTESATGYFILPEGVTTLSWQFTGTYKYADGEVVEVCKQGAIENVTKRTHYKLVFRYSADANGSLAISASVDTSVDHRNDHFAFSPDPVIKGEGFEATTPYNYAGGERAYNITALSPLTTLTLTVGNQVLDPISNTVEGVTVSGVNTTAMKITLSAPLFNHLPSGAQQIELFAKDASGGEATALLTYNLQGADIYTNSSKEVLAWTGGSTTLSATVFGSPASVEILYREVEGEWKRAEAKAGGSNIYTAQLEDMRAKTTYEYRLVIGGTEVGASRTFTSKDGAQIPNGGLEDWCKDGKVIIPWSNGNDPYWCTGNYGTTALGDSYNITQSSNDIRPGSKGSKSMCMESRYIVVKFAAGNGYIGSWGGIDSSMNAKVYFGQPFTFNAKPKAIRFWAKWNCGTIDREGQGVGKKGNPDLCKIFCCMATDRHLVDSSDGAGTTFSPSDENIKSGDARYKKVLYSAYMDTTQSQNEWKLVEVPFVFYGEDPNQVPTHLILTFTCSGYGDFFDGSTDSWMYVDDIELVY